MPTCGRDIIPGHRGASKFSPGWTRAESRERGRETEAWPGDGHPVNLRCEPGRATVPRCLVIWGVSMGWVFLDGINTAISGFPHTNRLPEVGGLHVTR